MGVFLSVVHFEDLFIIGICTEFSMMTCNDGAADNLLPGNGDLLSESVELSRGWCTLKLLHVACPSPLHPDGR